MKRILTRRNLLYILFLLIFVFIALEVILRIYNPFPTRLKGNKIVLPINQKYIIHNNRIPKLDEEIIHTKNSLGFRGDEKPENFENYLSIITVGGSTTECFNLSDSNTWPFLLEKALQQKFRNVWLNNAGLDGHSTFGHQMLVEDYLIGLKPKVIIFLVGGNDIGRDDLNIYDRKNTRGASKSFRQFIWEHSEVANIIYNLRRGLHAKRRNIGHYGMKFIERDTLTLSDEFISQQLAMHQKYLKGFEERILQLINNCEREQIEPIFITQPTFVGVGKDSITKMDLETIKLYNQMNGKLFWNLLELYNLQTKNICRETGTFVIDLANLLPKNSILFYDKLHYTNDGAKKVAEMLNQLITMHLKQNYPEFVESKF